MAFVQKWLNMKLCFVPYRSITLSMSYSMKKPVFDGPSPPKRPGSAFSLFIQDKFHRGDISVTGTDEQGKSLATARVKQLALEWKVMDKSEQQEYYDLYAKNNEKYQLEKKCFFDKMTEEERAEYALNRKKYLKKCRKYDEIQQSKREGTYDPPPKRVSGLNLYIAEQLALTDKDEHRDPIEHRKAFSEACQRWKLLTIKEQQPYIDEGLSITKERLLEYCKRHPQYVPNKSTTKKVSKE